MSQAGSSPAPHPSPSSGSKSATPAIKELTLTRIFHAPRNLVFKMWTDPKHVARWWGPHGYTNPVCEVDARPGGKILIHMQDPVMPVNPMTGVFEEVVEPERLVFLSMAMPDAGGVPQLQVRNTVTFEDLGNKTKLTMHASVLRVTPQIAACLDGMAQGWTETLERLGDVLVNPLDTTALAARELVFRRFLSAPRQKVFDAWTDPEQIGKWWGPQGFRTTTRAIDVRPGGAWEFTMHGPNGQDYQSKVVYLQVERPTSLAYQQAGEGADAGVQFHSTVTLGEMFGKTSLTLRTLFATAEERENNVKAYDSIEGGTQTLQRLAQHVEGATS